ncbi:DEKNAAC101078 [Brettanomyces naardenensis]|uniref:DEKNAAC101078 n=1 Tax=Brettanomyces naardenensis TaxID=13370 RepID=A0A448YHB1_BRENA|nr:DEKNAAC101078 [Brettanomyces naardenensis]
MTHISKADTYIEKSVQLLKANPRDTSVGVTYTHSKTEKKRPIVRFKTYNDKGGICLTFRTYKMKEFSRILNALGPRGSAITKHKEKKDELVTGESVKGESVKVEEVKELTESIQLEGFTSVMSNVEFKAVEEEKEEVEKKETGHGKRKKKKGRKH